MERKIEGRKIEMWCYPFYDIIFKGEKYQYDDVKEGMLLFRGNFMICPVDVPLYATNQTGSSTIDIIIEPRTEKSIQSVQYLLRQEQTGVMRDEDFRSQEGFLLGSTKNYLAVIINAPDVKDILCKRRTFKIYYDCKSKRSKENKK